MMNCSYVSEYIFLEALRQQRWKNVASNDEYLPNYWHSNKLNDVQSDKTTLLSSKA
jgi:hypothetical protein